MTLNNQNDQEEKRSSKDGPPIKLPLDIKKIL
jgi:hypothetical protein